MSKALAIFLVLWVPSICSAQTRPLRLDGEEGVWFELRAAQEALEAREDARLLHEMLTLADEELGALRAAIVEKDGSISALTRAIHTSEESLEQARRAMEHGERSAWWRGLAWGLLGGLLASACVAVAVLVSL